MFEINLSELKIMDDVMTVGVVKPICGLGLINRATNHYSILSYATDLKYCHYVDENLSISGIIIEKSQIHFFQSAIKRSIFYVLVDKPEEFFYVLHHFLCDSFDEYKNPRIIQNWGRNIEIHPTAIIDENVQIGNDVRIGAFTSIKNGTIIGSNVKIGSNCSIGSEGFQVIRLNNRNSLIRHVGGLTIQDNVEIGDNCTICKSLFNVNTNIGKNVKIDNLSYVAHNVFIDENVVITAGVKILGSVRIGRESWIGPNTSILNSISIGNSCMIGIGSVVTRDIVDNSKAYGVPAKVHE